MRSLKENIRRLRSFNNLGCYILLEDQDGIYKVTDVYGRGVDPVSRLGQLIESGWTGKPVIASVRLQKRKHFGYDIRDNAKQWLSSRKVGCALTRKSAYNKAYARALKIAQVVSRATSLPLIERTSRYSGVRN